MSSEASFSLVHLSEISKLRQCIGERFSSMAREISRITFKLHGQSSDTIHNPRSPSHNLDSRTRINAHNVHVMQPLTYCLPKKPRLDHLDPLKGIVEISEFDLKISSFHLRQCSPAPSYALGDVSDIDFRCSALIFRIWRAMFASGGSLFGFSVVAPVGKGLSFKISHFATDEGSIPELSMVFKATSTDEPACIITFLCFFNCSCFHPGT
jgi:hypothetical protein